jgi:hypothetical protein
VHVFFRPSLSQEPQRAERSNIVFNLSPSSYFQARSAMTVKAGICCAALLLVATLATTARAQSGSKASSCPAGSLTSSEAVKYAKSVIDKCRLAVPTGVGKTYTKAVQDCIEDVFRSTEGIINGLSCPQKSDITAIIAPKVGACGQENRAAATNVSRRMAREKAGLVPDQAAVKQLKDSAATPVIRNDVGDMKASASFSRALTGKLMLQSTVRGCCCNYCYQFGGSDQYWCMYYCSCLTWCCC